MRNQYQPPWLLRYDVDDRGRGLPVLHPWDWEVDEIWIIVVRIIRRVRRWLLPGIPLESPAI